MHEDYQYGLKDGIVVHVSDVESGKKCGCICPDCNNPFVAHKGVKNKHHFKHYSGINCKYSYETALHLMAKEIIEEKKYLPLPFVRFDNPRIPSAWYPKANNGVRPPWSYNDYKNIYFDRIELEKWEGNFRPDLKCFVGNKVVLVEITVTHGIDDEKQAKVRNTKLPMVEVDLSSVSKTLTKAELTSWIYEKKFIIQWYQNFKEDKSLKIMRANADKVTDFLELNSKKIKVYGKERQIYYCPKLGKEGFPKSYKDCCLHCYHFLYLEDLADEHGFDVEKNVVCIGHKAKQLQNLFDEIGAAPLNETSRTEYKPQDEYVES